MAGAAHGGGQAPARARGPRGGQSCDAGARGCARTRAAERGRAAQRREGPDRSRRCSVGGRVLACPGLQARRGHLRRAVREFRLLHRPAGRRLHARRAGGRDPDGRPRHRRVAGVAAGLQAGRRDRRGRRRADEELRRRSRRYRGQQGRARRADGSPGRRARRAATGGAGADRRPLSHRLHSRSVLPGLLRRAGDREGVRADG